MSQRVLSLAYAMPIVVTHVGDAQPTGGRPEHLLYRYFSWEKNFFLTA